MNWLYLLPIGIFLVGMALAFLGRQRNIGLTAAATIVLAVVALVWVIAKN
jgi:hypothetical protein